MAQFGPDIRLHKMDARQLQLTQKVDHFYIYIYIYIIWWFPEESTTLLSVLKTSI